MIKLMKIFVCLGLMVAEICYADTSTTIQLSDAWWGCDSTMQGVNPPYQIAVQVHWIDTNTGQEIANSPVGLNLGGNAYTQGLKQDGQGYLNIPVSIPSPPSTTVLPRLELTSHHYGTCPGAQKAQISYPAYSYLTNCSGNSPVALLSTVQLAKGNLGPSNFNPNGVDPTGKGFTYNCSSSSAQ